MAEHRDYLSISSDYDYFSSDSEEGDFSSIDEKADLDVDRTEDLNGTFKEFFITIACLMVVAAMLSGLPGSNSTGSIESIKFGKEDFGPTKFENAISYRNTGMDPRMSNICYSDQIWIHNANITFI